MPTDIAATIAVGATIAVRATKVIKVIAATGVTIATHEIIATINAEKREHSGKLANDPAALSNRSAMPVIAIDYVGVIRTKARGWRAEDQAGAAHVLRLDSNVRERAVHQARILTQDTPGASKTEGGRLGGEAGLWKKPDAELSELASGMG